MKSEKVKGDNKMTKAQTAVTKYQMAQRLLLNIMDCDPDLDIEIYIKDLRLHYRWITITDEDNTEHIESIIQSLDTLIDRLSAILIKLS